MKITINPAIRHVQPFIERLPEVFPVSGEVLHEGRNQIRAFDIGGESLVVKRYKRPHLFNRVMYSFFRKNKARRAYEHALRLRGMGFDTPEPVAWSEYRKDGLIADTYFVSRRSELTPLPQTMKQFRRRTRCPYSKPSPASPSASMSKGSATRISTRPISSGNTTVRQAATVSS